MSHPNPGHMELLYTPWMKTFLTFAAKAQREILLISPFIKLSLVRPLMLALPDRQITIKVVTRLSPQTFAQGASDILALEMLKTRPVAKGNTELFRMNRLHAKVYIFDRQTVLLGSSNLSISGFQRNFEMAVGVTDPHLAGQIIDIFHENRAFKDLVDDHQITALYPALANSFDPAQAELETITEPFIDLGSESSTDEDLPNIEEKEEESLPEVLTPVLQDDFRDRLQTLSDFTRASRSAKLDTLYGVDFESTALRLQKRNDEAVFDPADFLQPLKRDVAKIRHLVVPKLRIRCTKSSANFLTGLFVEPGILRSNSLLEGVQPDFYKLLHPLGHDFIRVVVTFHFARQVAYDPIGAGAASLAAQQFLEEVDFATPLIEQGLFVKLQQGDLGKRADRDFFYQLIGGVGVVAGLRQGINRTLRLLEEQLEFARVSDYGVDSKTLVQQIAHKMGVSLEYSTCRSGGTEHSPEFSSIIRLGRRHFAAVSGTNKKEAEKRAATGAIQKLESEPEYREVLLRAKGSLLSSPISAPYRFDRRRTETCRHLISELQLPAHTPLRLIDIALTHRSYLRIHESSRSHERLSLLGSKLIELVGNHLSTVETLNHGGSLEKLTRHRQLVAKASAAVYDNHTLVNFIASGNFPESAKTAPNFKQDIVQALGAVAYIVGGVEALIKFYEVNFTLPLRFLETQESEKEEITWLQEVAVARGLLIPEFSVERDPLSPENNPVFTAKCTVGETTLGPCHAKTMKSARRAVARLALTHLGVLRPTQDDGQDGE